MASGWKRNRVLLAAAVAAGLAARQVLRRLGTIDLRDQVVLITGGSRGLGLAMAEEFARQGARLALCARDEDELHEAAETVGALGAEVLTIQCDVSDRDQVNRMVDETLRRFGRIDILVNNAGVITVGPLATQTLADYQQSMAIMFWGPVYATMAVLPGMRTRSSGTIVNITSIGGKVAVPHLSSYSTAKFALVGYSEGLRAELAKDGIRVVTIVPGLMRTGSYLNAFFKGKHRIEFTLFGLLANLPFTSMSAEGAARQIVGATRRGDAELILTIQAQILARVHGLAPGLTADALGLADRFLPGADGTGAERYLGKNSRTPLTESFLLELGHRAARTYHQYADRKAVAGGAATEAVDRT